SHGVLDPTFGTGGTLAIDFPNGATVQALAIQSDLKIVAGGAGLSPVERFNTDGSLDITFGIGGFAQSPVFGNSFLCKAPALQTDGKIVPAGLLFTISGQVFGVARYDTNGILDSGFGSGGLTQQNLGGLNFANAVAITPGGNIIAVGESKGTLTGLFPPDKFAILELLSNGLPNPLFGTGGMVVSDFGKPAGANSVAIQGDGNLVVGGFAAASEAN